jgi:alpha-N-arabinofuranosidase
VLNVVNRHRDQPLEVEFETQDKQLAGLVEVAEVNGPDIKAENDFGATKVQTVTRSANAEGRKLRYRFPAHSYTMLRAKLV